jgi:hypothetical protein
MRRSMLHEETPEAEDHVSNPKHEKRDFVTKPQTLFIEVPNDCIFPRSRC